MIRRMLPRRVTVTAMGFVIAVSCGCETSSRKSVSTYDYSEEPPPARTTGNRPPVETERQVDETEGEMVSPGEMVPPGRMVPPGGSRDGRP